MSLKDNNNIGYFKVADIVSKETGVVFGPKEESLVRNKISRRMKALNISNVDDYCKFLTENENQELPYLISQMTTHHTFFFREFQHFEFLKENLPSIVANVKKSGRNTINIWCAACSYGQEVYSLAMFLSLHLKNIAPDMDFKILGSDVDPDSVKKSQNGVYRWSEIQKIPEIYSYRNWRRGKGDLESFAKINDQLKAKCEFKEINLSKPIPHISNDKFDIIFCRNVFIYFDTAKIKKITANLKQFLQEEGHLIIGVSETLGYEESSLQHLGKSVYQYTTKTKSTSTPAAGKVLPLSNIRNKNNTSDKSLIRVLCVDDSPIILQVLKKILSKDNGFEIVDTALNGQEAAEKLKKINVDLVTLDIHMPIMNGLEYLRTHNTAHHPPVVMISSVSQDDVILAKSCFEAGASDYIEKPTFDSLDQKQDEIILKLKTAVNAKIDIKKTKTIVPADSIFKFRIISDTNQKLRIIVCHPSDLNKMKRIISELKPPQPPTIVILKGRSELTESFCKGLEDFRSLPINILKEDLSTMHSDQVYVTHEEKLDIILKHFSERYKIIQCLGLHSPAFLTKISKVSKCALFLEDLGEDTQEQIKAITSSSYEIIPFTSFAYEGDKILADELGKAA